MSKGDGFKSPNYTQVPNDLWEMLPEMKEAEVRVTLAIIRLTFGFHVRKVRASLTRLQKMTGLSRQGVLNGIKEGLERGTLRKIKSRPTEWIVNVVDSNGQPSRPLKGNDSQPSRPSVLKEKSLKENEERKKILTPQQEMIGALSEITGLDYHIKRNAGRMARIGAELLKADYTSVFIQEDLVGWWYKNDWRGKKGQPPTPEQVLECVGKVSMPKVRARTVLDDNLDRLEELMNEDDDW